MTNTRVKLAFTGDICLSSLADKKEEPITAFPDWALINKTIGAHDFFVGNLECCLIDADSPEKIHSQKMAVPIGATDILQSSGFTDLNLANNHILDCGPGSIQTTRKALRALGVRHFGAGKNLQEAEQATYASKGDHTVAFLSACDNSEYYARGEKPGIAPIHKTRLGRRVREAARQADLVVVTLHADLEFSRAPGKWRQRLSRWLINQGAHLIIQHHPHVLQGVETYRNGLIAYSLGNFIFKLHGNGYQGHKARVFDTAILVVEADFEGRVPQLSHYIVPLRIGQQHVPCVLNEAEYKEAEEHFKTLSNLLSDPTKHRTAWFRRCRKEAKDRLFRMYYALCRGDVGRITQELQWLATRPEDRRWLLGLVSLGFL